jgi:hypothetical protein
VLLKEADTSSRLAWAFAQVLQRNPTKVEADELTALYGKHVKEFSETPSSAEALVKIGISERPGNAPQAELAAWTSIARVLLNLHETITRS